MKSSAVSGIRSAPATPAATRHLLRQADAAVEAAAGEALPDARRAEDAQSRGRAPARRRRCGRAGRCAAAPRRRSARGSCRRVAREADRVEERGLLGAAVARQVPIRGRRDVAPEVRQAPGDRDAEPGRRRRIAPVEVGERLLELALRLEQVARLDRGRDDLVVERRHDHLGAVVAHDAHAAEQMLLRAERRRGRALGRRSELVDGLVDAGGSEHPRRGGADDDLSPREPHADGLDQDEGVQLLLQVRHDLRVVERRRDVLAQRVEPARVAPGEQHVPLVGVLVHRVHRRRDPGRAHGAVRVGEARHLRTARSCRPPCRPRCRSGSPCGPDSRAG